MRISIARPRSLRTLLLVFPFVCAAAISTSSLCFAQTGADRSAQTEVQTPSAATSAVSGTVLDANGNVIEGANIDLTEAGSRARLGESKSGTMGQFAFKNVPPGSYVVTVSHAGMKTFVSGPVSVQAEMPLLMPNIVLQIEAATTSITVMDKETASIEQVKIAEQQRVLKVFPNFYTSFDWNAPSMLAKQKYHLATRTLVDPVTFLTTAGIAGAEQYKNVFPSFGSGISGYGKRYAAAYASHASGELLTRAVFPSIFHSDPRYFILGTGSSKSRAEHAIASTFLTRGDNGSRKVNLAEILGDFSAAVLSNAYFPSKERGANLVLINGFGNLGGDMIDNLFREFVFNRLTSRSRQ